MKRTAFLLTSLWLMTFSISAKIIGTIRIENPFEFNRVDEIAETENHFGNDFYIVDQTGKSVPHQTTYDGKLIFPVSVSANGDTQFSIIEGSGEPADTICCGRFYPERSDDIAWENEHMGYRIYGPDTQRKGERSFGYDLFFKYPGRPILHELYAAQCSPENWRKVNELKETDPAEAKRFEETFTYHINHGEGMDCFAVGPTLGAGVAAIVDNDTLYYPWCYETAEILDNGPLRFTVRLRFSPVVINGDSITEERLITLDKGSYLNRCIVSYSSMSDENIVVAGFPRRDESEAVMLPESGVIAYESPTQGEGNGLALLGLYMPDMHKAEECFGHILSLTTISPDESLTYYWGAAWDHTGIKNLSEWRSYLLNFVQSKSNPLIVNLIQNK